MTAGSDECQKIFSHGSREPKWKELGQQLAQQQVRRTASTCSLTDSLSSVKCPKRHDIEDSALRGRGPQQKLYTLGRCTCCPALIRWGRDKMLASPPNQDSGTATMQRARRMRDTWPTSMSNLEYRFVFGCVTSRLLSIRTHPSPGKAEGRTHSGKGEGGEG